MRNRARRRSPGTGRGLAEAGQPAAPASHPAVGIRPVREPGSSRLSQTSLRSSRRQINMLPCSRRVRPCPAADARFGRSVYRPAGYWAAASYCSATLAMSARGRGRTSIIAAWSERRSFVLNCDGRDRDKPAERSATVPCVFGSASLRTEPAAARRALAIGADPACRARRHCHRRASRDCCRLRAMPCRSRTG
jgi:hypothetical protein